MKNYTTKYMTFSMICNFFLSLLKIVFGLISNMKSLVADGIHSISDLLTDIIAIIGGKLSLKPADKDHPRGHGKIEYITSLIISIFIIGVGISIFKDSFNSKNITPSIYLSIVAIVTIIAKALLSRLLISKGKQLNNTILVSSGKESFTDVFSSSLVLIAIILSQFSNKVSFFKYSDMIVSVFISVLVLIVGIKLLVKNLSLLIGEVETDKDIQKQARDIVTNREDNLVLKKCDLYKLGSYYDANLIILVDGNMTINNAHILMDKIENDLKKSKLNIKYVTIHIEPINNKKKNK